jgi:F-type H+-transporting ATPase subunit a
MTADPIHQFNINNWFTIAKVGAREIAFTNSALFMLIAVMGIAVLMLGFTRSRALVPGRLQ